MLPPLPDLGSVTIFMQLAVAALLGMVMGMERSIAGKTAGMRTYGLVSMGACMFVVISLQVVGMYGTTVIMDPLRVLEGVITGVGFIGAGIIIFRDATLRGLTTAAGLWVAAAIGVAVGYGFYAVALFAAALTLFVFTAMWFIEQKIQELIPFGKSSTRIVSEPEENH